MSTLAHPVTYDAVYRRLQAAQLIATRLADDDLGWQLANLRAVLRGRARDPLTIETLCQVERTLREWFGRLRRGPDGAVVGPLPGL